MSKKGHGEAFPTIDCHPPLTAISKPPSYSKVITLAQINKQQEIYIRNIMKTLKNMYCADFLFILTLAHIPMMCMLLFDVLQNIDGKREKIMPGI